MIDWPRSAVRIEIDCSETIVLCRNGGGKWVDGRRVCVMGHFES